MKNTLIGLALSVSISASISIPAFGQSFYPAAGIITVDRNNTWKPIAVIPGLSGSVHLLTTSKPPAGCRADVYTVGNGSVFPLGSLGSVILQCGPIAVPGDYPLTIMADGVETGYVLRVK